MLERSFDEIRNASACFVNLAHSFNYTYCAYIPAYAQRRSYTSYDSSKQGSRGRASFPGQNLRLIPIETRSYWASYILAQRWQACPAASSTEVRSISLSLPFIPLFFPLPDIHTYLHFTLTTGPFTLIPSLRVSPQHDTDPSLVSQ